MPEQRTPKWRERRYGIPTGSRMADVLAISHGYLRELIAERHGQRREGISVKATEWGIENEPKAIAAYEMKFDVAVEPGKLISHRNCVDEHGPYFRGTPDGFVFPSGLIEIKCPEDEGRHIYWMMAGRVPDEHKPQMAAYLAMSRREWCDFVSFDPRRDPENQLFTVRYQRDEMFIRECMAAVHKFWELVKAERVPDTMDHINNPPELF